MSESLRHGWSTGTGETTLLPEDLIPQTFGARHCSELAAYIGRQLHHFFPASVQAPDILDEDIADALNRFFGSAVHIRRWCDPLVFSSGQTEKNTQFLYLLANSIYRRRGVNPLSERLFALNKALNGFTCYYTTALPEIFFVGHSVGVVLGKAQYSDYFMVFQGATVGQIDEAQPVLGRGVILFPHAVVAGRSRIGPNTFISANVSVINRQILGDTIVAANGTELEFIAPSRNILHDYFVE
jgi:serine O-acetyltransferase